MKRLVFPILALLAACGTPQEQCINRNTRDLRVVNSLIAETEGNLRRGYAIETVVRTDEYWGTCIERDIVDGQPVARRTPCLREREYTVERPKAIDLAAEARKLDSLQDKRLELSQAAEPVIARCRAAYPE